MMKDSSIELQVFDEPGANRIIRLETFVEGCSAYMVWEDTVNGDCGRSFQYIEELAEFIYENRKFINTSGQLDRITF